MLSLSDKLSITAIVIALISLIVAIISARYTYKESKRANNLSEKKLFKTSLILENWKTTPSNNHTLCSYAIKNIGDNIAYDIKINFINNNNIPSQYISSIEAGKTNFMRIDNNEKDNDVELENAIKNYNGIINLTWTNLSKEIMTENFDVIPTDFS